jgi:hypothetical protein
LKELYRQAHSIRHYDGDPALDGNPPTVYWQGEVSAQRFAELIVRECAKVLTQHGAYFSGDGEPYHYAASLIEDHFGVSE